MTANHDVVIVGSGHGGAQTAIALRQRGYAGSIALVGEEPDLPYERPPLSKAYLAGDKPFDRILIRPPAFWQERAVTMLPRRRVSAVDPIARSISTDSGETIGYTKLVWAAGGHARRLSCSGHDLAGVHSVRSRADVDRLMSELATTDRVCVVGGGYIGLEAAAVLTKLGKKVTLLESLDRVLARVAGPELSRFYEDEHRRHGVDLRFGTAVISIKGQDGRASGVRLADGEVIATDMVIVGIGIVPAVEPLLAAGAQGTNGVDVDGCGRTSLPAIYAIGDCAVRPVQGRPAPIRLESVQNANDMATAAAASITETSAPLQAVPWFWSDQYDLRLQTVGLSGGHDRTVTRGDIADRSFSIVYLREGRVIALDCVNATRDYAQGRKLVESGARAPLDRLADAGVSLKDLAS